MEKDGRDPQLRQVAALRRAQILIAEGQSAEALQLLEAHTATGMASLREELRGDALSARGDLAAARDAYQMALNTDIGGASDRSFVQMKLDDAAASSGITSATGGEVLPSLDDLPDVTDGADTAAGLE